MHLDARFHHGHVRGDGEVDATDYHFYRTALDAALNDETRVSFHTSRWSDNTAVKKALQKTP